MKILGWIIFAWAVGGAIYSLITASMPAVFFELVPEAVVAWIGWKIAHPTIKLGKRKIKL